MNLTNYDDYDWHDEDYTGQPPDDGQLLIAGREPDTDPDDNSVTVLEYGSSTDSDSFMSDEDMDECPDEYLDDCDNLDAVILPYLTGSKPGKKKRKKKHKKKSKKKASASSTRNLSKEDWLHYRKCGITGTDAGAILGLNPYRSAFQVYHDKISDTIENIDNEAMRQGRDLEDYVAQRFTEATGLKVRRANAIYQSKEHPLLLADFDRLIVGQKAGLECKTVSPFSADKWADGKIPAHYLAQVDHYLAVSGFDCWYVAALIFGRELVIHKIVTDKQVLSDLIDKEELFWTNHVVPQIPPAPNGCDCDTQQINQLYEVDNRDKTADLSALHGLLDKRQELSDQIEQMEQEKTAIEQQVKLQMQDAAYGTAPGYKVSWVSSESKRVDSQRLKKEQPDIFNRYSKNVSSRRFTIVHAA